jgi:hypothetical protein
VTRYRSQEEKSLLIKFIIEAKEDVIDGTLILMEHTSLAYLPVLIFLRLSLLLIAYRL